MRRLIERTYESDARNHSPGRRLSPQSQTHSSARENGIQGLACENGADALAAAKSGEHDVKLVMSDIMMPTMDGLELLRQIREDEKLKAMPVILITAVSEKDYIERARSLG